MSETRSIYCSALTKKGHLCRKHHGKDSKFCYIHKKYELKYTSCAGFTKKGERCKRRPSKGLNYCCQHKQQTPLPVPEELTENTIECPVCFERETTVNIMVQLHCHPTHCLHVKCLAAIYESNIKRCPLCRANI